MFKPKYKILKNRNNINILEKNLDKNDYYMLSYNQDAINLLENNYNKVNWNSLSSTLNGIHLTAQLDKEYMKNQINDFKHDLVMYVFNPDRILRYCERYDLNFDDIDEIY